MAALDLNTSIVVNKLENCCFFTLPAATEQHNIYLESRLLQVESNVCWLVLGLHQLTNSWREHVALYLLRQGRPNLFLLEHKNCNLIEDQGWRANSYCVDVKMQMVPYGSPERQMRQKSSSLIIFSPGWLMESGESFLVWMFFTLDSGGFCSLTTSSLNLLISCVVSQPTVLRV